MGNATWRLGESSESKLIDGSSQDEGSFCYGKRKENGSTFQVEPWMARQLSVFIAYASVQCLETFGEQCAAEVQ